MSIENTENENSYTRRKIVILKTLAISKILCQSLITTVSRHIGNEQDISKWAWKNTEGLFWKNSSPKIKHETLCNDYKGGGLKNIDILNKVVEWKLISLFLIKKSFGISFKFYSNLFFKRNKINFFPSFYRKIFLYWKKNLARKPEVLSCILSQYLWYNKNIQVDKNSIYLVRFSKKNVNYVFQVFRPDGFIKTWHELKTEYKLHGNS